MYLKIILFGLLLLSPLTFAGPHNKCTRNRFHCFESGARVADCDNQRSWIRLSKLCDGKLDCPNGEDEAIFVCKKHPEREVYRDYFACATGGTISTELACNKEPNDCFDNSDEINCEYNPLNAVKWQGDCSESQIECLPGECKDWSSTCDGKHDCSNGLDESLKICIRNCTETEFQCGNGKCIALGLLCDKKYDCPDGADEVPVVCEENVRMKDLSAPKICKEPPNLKFSNTVKVYQKRKNGTRYVLPNTPVKFECLAYEELVGSEWNVCGPNGEWAHPLAICNDPNLYGCYLPLLRHGRPKIYGCSNSILSSCDVSKELIPPINNMTVRFKCNEGFEINPKDLEQNTAICADEQWIPLNIKPICRKIYVEEDNDE